MRLPDSSRVNLRDAADRIIPSVVSVRAFGGPALGVSSGSGVIISDDGMVATNHHVVEGAGRIRVTLSDRTEHWAKVVGADENTDLALLRIDAGKKLVAARFGNSDELQTGQWLLAVGNPFGLRSTVTAGILSARGRRIGVLGAADRIESFLQTDAAVNPGSSGGALVNARGELVGINTAILSESGRHEGFNFAIPGNLARRVLEDLRDYGRTRRATIGAYVQTATPSITRQAGLKEAVGVQITELVPGGAALRAGLEPGDILTSLDGQDIGSAQVLQEILSQYRPGDRPRLSFIRGKRRRELTLTLRRQRPSAKARTVTDHLAPLEDAPGPIVRQ